MLITLPEAILVLIIQVRFSLIILLDLGLNGNLRKQNVVIINLNLKTRTCPLTRKAFSKCYHIKLCTVYFICRIVLVTHAE